MGSKIVIEEISESRTKKCDSQRFHEGGRLEAGRWMNGGLMLPCRFYIGDQSFDFVWIPQLTQQGTIILDTGRMLKANLC